MTAILFSDEINKYAAQMSSDELPVLSSLERDTYRREMQPVMLSGHIQGAFLQMLSQIIRPKKVLDIGTFTGYSAICLAQGLVDGGIVHTVELEEERRAIAEKYFKEADLETKIITHFGDATKIIASLNEPWDLVFIDADKPNYETYFDLVIDKMNIGGLIIADNVLFEARVLLPEEQQAKNEKAMHLFNKKIKNDKRVAVVLLPFRDGFSIIRKIKN